MFFNYKEDCFGVNIFNEVTLLNFVAQSYAKSALELYKKVAEYDSEDANEEKDTTYFYLPAKFCFRQYLELKLKCLIMIYKEKSFKTIHKLSSLLEEVKKSGFNYQVFSEPIQYIENIENGDCTLFRYLIDKDFNSKRNFLIPMFDYEKVKQYIDNIENKYEWFIAENWMKKSCNYRCGIGRCITYQDYRNLLEDK